VVIQVGRAGQNVSTETGTPASFAFVISQSEPFQMTQNDPVTRWAIGP